MIIDETIQVSCRKGQVIQVQTESGIIEIGFNPTRKRTYALVKPRSGHKVALSRSYEKAVLQPGEKILFV